MALSNQVFGRFIVRDLRRYKPPKKIPVPTFVRFFSRPSTLQLRTSELTDTQLKDLKANPDSLWNDIHQTANWGTGKSYGDAPEETGMSRLTLSDADKQARDWFVETTRYYSCKTYIDKMGNTFAIRPGLNNNAPATFAGSHLDTQPTGGRFDGVLGVCAGIEMLRVLDENWIETEGPVGVVNWTNEEGARFPYSMMGSGVWADVLPLERAHGMVEVGDGQKTVKQELQRIGYFGQEEASYKTMKMGGHFELHIEQGPHLVSAEEKIGVVEGAQAYTWSTVTITGRDCHTGTTSFEHRSDALYEAAHFMIEVRELAKRFGGLASVGIIKAYPGAVNTVPGLVTMSLDIRHKENERLAEIMGQVKLYAQRISALSHPDIEIDIKQDFHNPATVFQPEAVHCVEEAAQSVLGERTGEKSLMRRMTSGAGHDSVFSSRRCPTAMVFSPCRDGVSHHPAEWCSKEDSAIGASVLMGAVLRFDRYRHSKGEFD